MYDDLLTGIKNMLLATNQFGSVQCGLGRPTAYPAASIWLHKNAAGAGKADPMEDCTVLVQIQGYADDDTEQSYLDMMAMVATVRKALHQHHLPGKGAKALTVPDFEAMRMEQGGPTVYLLRVQAVVTPSNFTII